MFEWVYSSGRSRSMASAIRRSVRQALASAQQLCKTRIALQSNGLWQPDGGHSVGLQRFVESSANLQQRHAPWFLVHRRDLVQVSRSQAPSLPPWGGSLRGELQSMNVNGRDRLSCQEDFRPPHGGPAMVNARRVARFVQLEGLKTRLEAIPDNSIGYEELLRHCMDSGCASSVEEARAIARLLDESGQILVLGNAAYLHPQQVARAIENAMPLSMAPRDDRCREELERMEKQKGEIDVEAKRLVRGELWCGLGFMTIQTAALMRLTFWEMSWDVMEPICFFVTTTYFLAGYAFFLGTSRDPTFEGFFKARLEANQRKLMKRRDFDIERFRELQRICQRSGLAKSSPARGILDALEDT